MTISKFEALSSGPYDGGGALTLDYDFTIYQPTELDVIVQRSGVPDQTLVYPTDYTVTGVGDEGGGTVTLTSAALAPAGTKIYIEPNVELSQARPFSSQSSTDLSELEAAYDKLTSIARQLKGGTARAVLIPRGSGIGQEDAYAEFLNARNETFLARDDAEDYAERAESASNVVTRLYPRRGTFVADGTTGSFALEGEYDDPALITLYIDGLVQSTTTDYTATVGSGDTTITLVENGSPANFPKGAVVHWIASFQIGAPVAAAEGTSQYDRVFASRTTAQTAVFPVGMNTWAVLDPPPPHGGTQKLLYVRAPDSTDNPAIVSANGVKGIPAQEITPEHFGYNPDGTNQERTDAFDAAIAYIKEIGGGTLHLGAKEYSTLGGHRVDFDNFSMVGVSQSSTSFKCVANATAWHFEGVDSFEGPNYGVANGLGAVDGNINNIELRNIFFWNGPAAYPDDPAAIKFLNSSMIGLKFVGTRNNVIDNCKFDGFWSSVDFYGTNEPSFVRDCYFEHSLWRNLNVNYGGGHFIRSFPLEVSRENRFGKAADPDFPIVLDGEGEELGTYFAPCTSIWISNNQIRHWPATVSDGIVIRGIDGLDIHDNHFLRCNGSQILFDQQYTTAYMWNIKVYNNHFDGTSPYTDNIIKIAEPAYATSTIETQGWVFGARYDIYNNNFDEAGGNELEDELWEEGDPVQTGCLLTCRNKDVVYLNVQDNLFRRGLAENWINITHGRGLFNFVGNKVFTRVNSTPSVVMALDSAGGADFFENSVISGNTFAGTDGEVPGTWIELTGAVNNTVITGNTYEDGSVNAFLLDSATGTHKVYGNEVEGGNVSLLSNSNRLQTGTFTPTVYFATNDDATFTYTDQYGEYHREGNFAWLNINLRFDVSPYTTASGPLVINLPGLPFDIETVAGKRTVLNVEASNVDVTATTYGITARVTNSSSLRLQLSLDNLGTVVVDETNIPSGQTNVVLSVSGMVMVS